MLSLKIHWYFYVFFFDSFHCLIHPVFVVIVINNGDDIFVIATVDFIVIIIERLCCLLLWTLLTWLPALVCFFSLFGQYVHRNFQWLSVKLNFATVLNRKCRPENYTHWSPNDEVQFERVIAFLCDTEYAEIQ